MKKRLFTSMMIFILSISCVLAENNPKEEEVSFTFYASADVSATNDQLMNQLKDLTFIQEEVVPGDPVRRTVIDKGDIYNAINCIRKGLRKEVKDGIISQENCENTLLHVLQIGIAAFYADNSNAFETALHNTKKDFRQKLALFNAVKLKN